MMKALIRFSLRRRFSGRLCLVLNVLLWAAFGLLAHIDALIPLQPAAVTTILLDSTVEPYRESLLACTHEGFSYVPGDRPYDETTALLHRQDGQWQLMSCDPLAEAMVSAVKQDLRDAVAAVFSAEASPKEQAVFAEYRQAAAVVLTEQSETARDNPHWLVLSLACFLLLSYSGMLANEVLAEKEANTLGLVIAACGVRVHFLAKIATAYLTALIQLAVWFCDALFWLVIRAAEDGLSGLERWLALAQSGGGAVVMTGTLSLGPGWGSSAVCLLTGLWIVQIAGMLMAAKAKNNAEASAVEGPFYLILVGLYYLLLMRGDEAFMAGRLAAVLAYCPVASMVFLPCRLQDGLMSPGQGLLSALLSAGALAALTVWSLPRYCRSLLGQPGRSRPRKNRWEAKRKLLRTVIRPGKRPAAGKRGMIKG